MEATVRHIFPQSKGNNNLGCLVCVVLVAILIFVRCDRGGGEKFVPSKSDTTRSVAFYQRPLQGDIALDEVFRVSLDTFKVVRKDTLKDGIKEVREWRRDTLYFTKWKLDTLIDRSGKILIDSISKLPITQWSFQPHPKNLIVYDFNYQMKQLNNK